MEQHGKIPKQNVVAIIPARFSSTRLKGKLLLPLNGKSLILHTLEQTKKASNISRVIVATDDKRIFEVVENSGNEAVLTSTEHQSGSDRIAEVALNLPENSIIVNVQGDEPLISPLTIEKAVEAVLENENIDVSTTGEKITDYSDVLNPDVVKVVTDKDGFALYFSRSPIPFLRDSVKQYGSLENALQEDKSLLKLFRKHTGLYVYRREFLLKYTKLNQTKLEKTEMLEQLRILENGARIKVVEVSESSIGVDTQEDFRQVEEIIKNQSKNSIDFKYRKATLEDISQIAEVHVKSWQESFKGIVSEQYLYKKTVEERKKFLQQNFSETDTKTFVVENSESKIIGFAEFGDARNNIYKCEAELYTIYFLRQYQRRGIGGKLFDIVVKNLISSGYQSMYLETLEKSPYNKFYEKMGGELIGKDSFEYGSENYKTIIYGWSHLNKK